MPDIAAPIAKCSQFLRAISVEPNAPVNIGTLNLTFLFHPYSVSVFTLGKRAVSGFPCTPLGSPFAPFA